MPNPTFQPQGRYPVAVNPNTTNTQGKAPLNANAKTSLYITNTIPAGGNLPVPVTGNQFYVTYANAAFSIRPSGGVANLYSQGTGLRVDISNSFDFLYLQNPNSFPVIFQIFVGFDEYIDNRLILAEVTTPNVLYPTYPTPNSAADVEIPDMAGEVIQDINGNEYYAIQRQALLVFNTDTGVTYLIQKFDSVISNGPAIGAVYPQTSLNIPAVGDYKITVGGANINAIVSEIYTAIPKP